MFFKKEKENCISQCISQSNLAIVGRKGPWQHTLEIHHLSLCGLELCYVINLLALVESSLEVLLMLALLSRFFLQSVSLCLVWLEEGGDEEELVLARESSSDIPVWIGEKPGPEAESTPHKLCKEI